MDSATILILRTSAMGDVVMASHLAEGLRHAYPDARIIWLVEPQLASLLEHNPAIDALLVWPKLQWKELFRTRRLGLLIKEIKAFVRMLRAEQCTLAIDAQGLFRTRLLAWLSGAQERVGFASREPGHVLMTRLIVKGSDGRQMGSEYFHLLNQLGIATTGLKQTIQLPAASYADALELLAKEGVQGPYAVCAPFTTRPQKHWFDQSWTELSAAIRNKLGLPVVWLGGPDDCQHAALLARGGGGVSLAGKSSLGVSAAIVAKAAVLIGVDTGLTHLGSAFGVPTVALFGATCPYTETCSPHTVVLYHRQPCSPCRRTPTCDGRYECMVAITPHEVMQVISQLQVSGG